MKTLILAVNLIFVMALVIFLNKEPIERAWEKSEHTINTYTVPGVRFPTDLELVNNSLFILKESSLINWDIEQREIKDVREVETNAMLDSEDNRLFICSWENYEISFPDENATVITWSDLQETEEIPLRKTVRPIRCLKEKIITMNAFPTLEERYYETDRRSSNLREIEYKTSFVKGEDKNITVDKYGQIIVTKKKANGIKDRLISFTKLLIDNINPR